MATLQERLTEVFPQHRERGFKKEIADLCGVSPASVSNWFGNAEKVSTISRERAEKLINHYVLPVTVAWLAEGKLPKLTSDAKQVKTPRAPTAPVHDVLSSEVGEPLAIKSMRLLPLVGEVKGGDDGYLEEFQYPVGHGEGLIEYPTSDPNAYALRVRGDSMHPRYRAGEFVVVEPNIEWQEGDDVVVAFTNGRKMLKQINWRRDGEVQLLSINNGYAPLTLPLSDIEFIQLVAGRARRSALKK